MILSPEDTIRILDQIFWFSLLNVCIIGIITIVYILGFLKNSKLLIYLSLIIMMCLSSVGVVLSFSMNIRKTYMNGKLCLHIDIRTISLNNMGKIFII